jgi:lysophospholipid acyltransferase (LPLAT)-like uncharacterized protein
MKERTSKHSADYGLSDLSSYTLKQRLLIRIGGLFLFWLVSVIGRTIRFEVEGWENFEAIEAAGKTPIYAFWHNRIVLTTFYFRKRGIVVMTSRSFDGEYTARLIQRFGYGVIRGSSSRGAVSAVVGMIRLLNEGIPVGFAIDGPKGPRYVAKPGMCLLAKKTGQPLMPFIIETEKRRELRSWDALQIPRPFSRAKLIIATPIYVSKDANESEIDQKQAELQESLEDLVLRGENWRKLRA